MHKIDFCNTISLRLELQFSMTKTGIQMIVFDLDGTLIDSKADITLAVNLTLQKLNQPPLPEHLVEQCVAVGIQPLMAELFANHGSSQVEYAIEEFKKFYTANLITHTRLYPKIQEVLDFYSSTPKVILTNKSNAFIDPIVQGLDIKKYFLGCYGRTSFPTQKPDAGPLLAIAKQHSVALDKMLMVGDTEIDMMAGKNAGTKTCAVLYGYGQKETLHSHEPDFIAARPEDLLDLF